MTDQTTGLPRSRREKSSSAVSVSNEEGIKVDESMTVNRTAVDLYAFLKEPRNFQMFIPFLKRAEAVDATHLRCGIEVSGHEIQWLVETVTDRPAEVIAWRTVEPSDIDSAGSVWFHPLPESRGTVVRVILKYDTPNEFIKGAVESIAGEAPEKEVRESLRRFKSLMETGEIPSTEGQPHGPHLSQIRSARAVRERFSKVSRP